MYVILSTRGSQRWLSGIFRDSQDAVTCRASLPQSDGVQDAVQAVSPTDFPFFIVEDSSGFSFLDAVEAMHLIRAMPAPAQDAEPILFAIVSEYQPDQPGRDEMGCLRHVHLDAAHLADLRKSGPLALI